jgi:glutathione-specific gamma-glutamylcyclotransferase
VKSHSCGGTTIADAGTELWAKLSWERDPWIFAYGPLMLDPRFPYSDATPAMLYGHHRSFCVQTAARSDRPGLALGLDRGGACKGIAYCVPAVDVPAALAYLCEREMRCGAYELREVEIELPGRRVTALAFVVDRGHRNYVGSLSLAETARAIRAGAGKGVLDTTLDELDRLGPLDGHLSRLAQTMRAQAAPERRAA